MAIDPKTLYPGKINGASGAYPFGSARDITAPSDGTGTPWIASLINDIWGFFQSLLTEAGITPSGAPDQVGTADYMDAFKAITVPFVEYDQPVGPNISLKGYLDRQGVWAEDESGINQALAYIGSLAKRDTLRLPPRSSIVMASGITINSRYVSLDGNGAELDFSAMAGGTAIIVSGSSTTDPTDQNVGEFENLIVTGPGRASAVWGWLFNEASASAAGSKFMKMRNIVTKSFLVGERYEENAENMAAQFCNITDCGTGIIVANVAPGGRSLGRFGGTLYDNDLAFGMVNADGGVNFFGTSLLDNLSLISITGGVLGLHGCDLKANDYAATPIVISGAGSGVNMVGGSLELVASPAGSFDHWVNAAADSYFRARGVNQRQTATATGEFATGDGVVKVRGTITDGTGTPLVLHSDRSMLIDGGFEDTAIRDFVSITEDGVAVTDPFIGTNVNLTISGTYATTGGGQSLRYEKSNFTGSKSRFAIAIVPVEAFDAMSSRLFYRDPGSAGGSFKILYSFARVSLEGAKDPIAIVHYQEVMATHTVTLSGADTGWAEDTFIGSPLPGVDNKAPEWATHFIVEIDGELWNVDGDFMYFDDVNVNILG